MMSDMRGRLVGQESGANRVTSTRFLSWRVVPPAEAAAAAAAAKKVPAPAKCGGLENAPAGASLTRAAEAPQHLERHGMEAAGGEAARQKAIQFAAVLHTQRHQRPMFAYEQQQEFQRFYFDNKLTSIMPHKRWSDNIGWQINQQQQPIAIFDADDEDFVLELGLDT
eukprot:607931-Pelagomonas_calceolata.AAC.3